MTITIRRGAVFLKENFMPHKNVAALQYCLAFLLFTLCRLQAWEIRHHDIVMKIVPEQGELQIVDKITCSDMNPQQPFCFVLHGTLKVTLASAGWKLENLGTMEGGNVGINSYFPDLKGMVPLTGYRLLPPASLQDNKTEVELHYHGQIAAPLQQGEEYARSFAETPGIISSQGVYLAGTTFWYPRQGAELVSFRLVAELPAAWQVVAQGKRLSDEVKDGLRRTLWDSPELTEEIYVVAAAWQVYTGKRDDCDMLVYLRTPDYRLAHNYLSATAPYLDMYEQLLGTYPYRKFAALENFWETGYGMPSFTLLGPRVIRFPFILYSSYPHEILHNWWGNGVFVDYTQGNWCEGLTAYLADHMLKEQQGEGATYRYEVLQKYRNFVHSQADFPLAAFQSRHSAASEAVGYGKSLMFFHELRLRLGDAKFIELLRTFYQKFLWHKATFSDWQSLTEKMSGQSWERFFAERVRQKGAPELRLCDVKKRQADDKIVVQFTIAQNSDSPGYQLALPIAITVSGMPQAFYLRMPLLQASQQATIALAGEPLRIDVDPEFDVFRKLDLSEIPPSIGQVFGATSLYIIVAEKNNSAWQEACEKLGRQWGVGQNPAVQMKKESDVDALPTQSAIWFVGRPVRWMSDLRRWFALQGVCFQEENVVVAGETLATDKHWLVVSGVHPYNPELAIGWLYGTPSEALPAIARKLPHYAKYSYLAFAGGDATNVLKGRWPITQSAMSFLFAPEAKMATLPKRQPLSPAASPVRTELLKAHVAFLAAPEREGRGLASGGLEQAALYIAEQFKQYGLKPAGDNDTFFENWEREVKPLKKRLSLKNVVAAWPGQEAKFANEPVVVGAHYDHLGSEHPAIRSGNAGQIHYGADDNASGVALLLELARILGQGYLLKRPVVLVAFSAEEVGCLGSEYFVSDWTSRRQQKITAMLNLDTVGRLREQKLYVFGSTSGNEWPLLFRTMPELGLELILVPGNMQASDHQSFIAQKIPAIHLCTGVHSDYHTPQDTLEKIEWAALSQITLLSKHLVEELANRDIPLTPGDSKQEKSKPEKTSGKRASLGSVPDFAYTGKGVLLAGVGSNSPAAKAGMLPGDILTGIGEFTIESLSDLSRALQYYPPGTLVNVTFLRQGKEVQAKIVLVER
jgi:hypothetical protein